MIVQQFLTCFMGDILAAAIQMQSTDAVDKNLEASLRLVHAAIKSGATLISLPRTMHSLALKRISVRWRMA